MKFLEEMTPVINTVSSINVYDTEVTRNYF